MTIVLLVQEKASLLPVFKIHLVSDAVFHNFRLCARRKCNPIQSIIPFVLFQSFVGANGHIIAFVDAVDVLAVLGQYLIKQGENHIFA